MVDEEEMRMLLAHGDAPVSYTFFGCPFALGCCCKYFESNFLCVACDRRWEEHETFFETDKTRRRGGRPHGEAATWDGAIQGLQ